MEGLDVCSVSLKRSDRENVLALHRTTRGEKKSYFQCGSKIFVLVTGGIGLTPPVYCAFVTKTPERERSRVNEKTGFNNTHFVDWSGM